MRKRTIESSDVLVLERDGWEALCGPEGEAFYDEVMANEGVMLFPGMVLDKEAALAAIASSPPWESFELNDTRVIESGDCAVVVYSAVAVPPGGEPYRAVMASTYVRQQGRWRLLVHQQSPTVGEPG